MINYNYQGGIQKIKDAITEASRVLSDENFYRLINQKNVFDYSNCTASQVTDAIKSCSLQLSIRTYKHPWGPSLGKEYPSDPTGIYINIARRKFDERTIPSVVNTLIHEAVHAADADNVSLDFNHGDDNKSIGKGNSAPYWIGCLAEMLLQNLGKVITVGEIDAQSRNDCG